MIHIYTCINTFWQGDIYSTTMTFIRRVTITKKVIAIHILLFLRYDIFFFFFFFFFISERTYAANEFTAAQLCGSHISREICSYTVNRERIDANTSLSSRSSRYILYRLWNYEFYTIFFFLLTSEPRTYYGYDN